MNETNNIEQHLQASGTDMAKIAADLRTKDQPERVRATRSPISMLVDPLPEIKLRSADELVKVGMENRQLLTEACSEDEPKETTAIRRVLLEIDRLWDETQMPELFQLATMNPEEAETIHIAVSEDVIDLSRSALELLDEQETQISEEKLLALLEIDTGRQRSALHALDSLRETGLDVMKPYFSDPDVLVRRVVASAVAMIGTERAAGYMVTALNDEDVFVRGVATTFLVDADTQ